MRRAHGRNKRGRTNRRAFRRVILVCVFLAAFALFSQRVSFDGFLQGGTLAGYAAVNAENPDGVAAEFADPLYGTVGIAGIAGAAGLADNAPERQFTDADAQSAPPPEPVNDVPLEDNPSLLAFGDVLSVNDITLQPETDENPQEPPIAKEAVTVRDIDMLRSLDYLQSYFYTVDSRTAITAEDFDADRFLAENLKIDNSIDGPKVLIFHTHSCEMFADSNPSDPYDGVMGAGRRLAELLTEKFGIECLHHTGRYDIVDGVNVVSGAYERMEPEIERILAENPSIQVAIDIHRDGLTDETRKLVTTENGIKMAQIMFFNGLCKINKNGVLTPIAGLENPYTGTNLALSFAAQLAANTKYPNFTRKVYLNAYRYSLNMLPKSMLIEVGAQTNTREEAFNAMGPLADILAEVLLDNGE